MGIGQRMEREIKVTEREIKVTGREGSGIQRGKGK